MIVNGPSPTPATAELHTGPTSVDPAVAGARKPLVYIAGPYTSPDPVLNVRRAVKMGERVAASGAVPIVPHLSMLWHLVSPQEIDYWYQYDLEILLHCHALIRLVGASPGADREVEFAERAGIPVFVDGPAESFWVPFLAWQDQWRP